MHDGCGFISIWTTPVIQSPEKISVSVAHLSRNGGMSARSAVSRAGALGRRKWDLRDNWEPDCSDLPPAPVRPTERRVLGLAPGSNRIQLAATGPRRSDEEASLRIARVPKQRGGLPGVNALSFLAECHAEPHR